MEHIVPYLLQFHQFDWLESSSYRVLTVICSKQQSGTKIRIRIELESRIKETRFKNLKTTHESKSFTSLSPPLHDTMHACGLHTQWRNKQGRNTMKRTKHTTISHWHCRQQRTLIQREVSHVIWCELVNRTWRRTTRGRSFWEEEWKIYSIALLFLLH